MIVPKTGDLVYDVQRRIQGTVAKIDDKSMVWYEEDLLASAPPAATRPMHITHASNLVLLNDVAPENTITGRMIRDVLNECPSFSEQDGEIFWTDRDDDTTYAVTMLIPGLSEEQSGGLDSSTVGV